MSNATLERLRQLLNSRGQDRARRKSASRPEDFNADWLPEHGLSPGDVSEWIADGAGAGALQLALTAARKAVSPQSRWLVVDSTGDLFPAGWEEAGLNLSRTVFVQGINPVDALWTVEQSLRSRGVDVVCCRFGRLTPVMGRRLKIAAESGGSLCLMFRGPEALRETSYGDLRVLVSPLPSSDWLRRRVRIEVLKIRNGFPGRVTQVELNDETDALRVVPELADSAPACRAAGA
jgi:hypothetical protein